MKRIVRMGRGVKAKRAGVKEMRSFLLQPCAGKKKRKKNLEREAERKAERKD